MGTVVQIDRSNERVDKFLSLLASNWFKCEMHSARVSIGRVKCYCCFSLCYTPAPWNLSLPGNLTKNKKELFASVSL